MRVMIFRWGILAALLMAVLSRCGANGDAVLSSSLAGHWYPARSSDLTRMLDQYFEKEADKLIPQQNQLLGLILPHAGYQYSGKVAVNALRYLTASDLSRIKRIIVVGPSHNFYLQNEASIPLKHTHYRTPLGKIPLDVPFMTSLTQAAKKAKQPLRVHHHPQAHRSEHSIQIELPLLQRAFQRGGKSDPGFKLVPIIVGELTEASVEALASAIWQGLRHTSSALDETLIVASTDFTHYGTRFQYLPFRNDLHVSARLKSLDLGAWSYIKQGKIGGFAQFCQRTGATICGRHAVQVVMAVLTKWSRLFATLPSVSTAACGNGVETVAFPSPAPSSGSPSPSPTKDSPHLIELVPYGNADANTNTSVFVRLITYDTSGHIMGDGYDNSVSYLSAAFWHVCKPSSSDDDVAGDDSASSTPDGVAAWDPHHESTDPEHATGVQHMTALEHGEQQGTEEAVHTPEQPMDETVDAVGEPEDHTTGPSGLTKTEKRTLLRLARMTLEDAFRSHDAQKMVNAIASHADSRAPLREAVIQQEPANTQSLVVRQGLSITDAMRKDSGVFVTLHSEPDHALRGCIGDILPNRPLFHAVAGNALNAAFVDTRFPPLNAHELESISIEISALTPPRHVRHHNDLVIGQHGAVFLPQVATEQEWNKEQWLSHLCLKAGLPPRAWHSEEAAFFVFEADVWKE